MCRHCERLVEDADFKNAMHEFMARTAKNYERSLREKGMVPPRTITADDIDIVVHLTHKDFQPKLDLPQWPDGINPIARLMHDLSLDDFKW